MQGKHVVISTSTSSGKSMVFNAPVLKSILEDPANVAIYMFPTKALAQDQLRALNELISASPVLAARAKAATLDGMC
jgi:DEAD/DEAH box helicase domain-containing protein